MKRIAVCVKILRKENTNSVVGWDGTLLGQNDINALKLALLIKENEDAFISVYIMAPKKYYFVSNKILEKGVDRVVFISDNRISGADSLGTAYVLAATLKEYSETCILMGEKSEDSSTGQVPIQIASILDYFWIPDILLDTNILVASSSWPKAPIIITISQKHGDFFPTITSLIDAKMKPIISCSLDNIELDDCALKYTEVTDVSDMDLLINKDNYCIYDKDEAIQLMEKICLGGKTKE